MHKLSKKEAKLLAGAAAPFTSRARKPAARNAGARDDPQGIGLAQQKASSPKPFQALSADFPLKEDPREYGPAAGSMDMNLLRYG
jgi:hypothetical protein